MKSIILNEPDSIEQLKDAVVIIGNSINDLGEIFKSEKNSKSIKPLVYVHAWTTVDILSHMSTIGPFDEKIFAEGRVCSK
jgi:hypothetical protein